MSGYIKLHRAVRGTAIAQHPEYFAAWVHLLCMATHKTHDQVVGTKVVTLKPGDLVFGRQKFSATTGISENKVRSALKVMKDLGMITSKSHAKYSVITIVNWAKYQTESPANNQQATSKAPAKHHKQEGSNNGSKMEKEIDIVISYLNDAAGKNFRGAKTDRSNIGKRLEEYGLDAVKEVIDRKSKKWRDDPKMRDYLRPSTLFRPSNFEAYLNESDATPEPKQEPEPRPAYRKEMPKPDRPPRRDQ